jgi:CspA family cold shock protein
MPIGTVKWFDLKKGYGFIQPDEGSKEVVVRLSAVECSGLSRLSEKQRLSYDLEPGYGSSSAVNLKALVAVPESGARQAVHRAPGGTKAAVANTLATEPQLQRKHR